MRERILDYLLYIKSFGLFNTTIWNVDSRTNEKNHPKFIRGSIFKVKYYFIALPYLEYSSVYNAYLANPQISAEELRTLFTKDDPTSKNIIIAMNFFSRVETLPKQEVVDNLAKDFLQELGLPKGSYPFIIYTNLIVNRVVLPDGEDIRTEIPIHN